jgi:crotonobetainyl-CoA:carnitine CoA-transferase CaiB-like acyl-CoA transferase
MSMLTYLASWQLNVGFEPERTPNGSHPSLVPAQTFETRDGFLSVFVGNDPMFVRFVAALEDGRLADPAFATTDGRLVHRAALVGIVQENLKTKDSAEWVRILSTAGVPCAPVNSIGEALEDPHVAARGLVGTAVHPSYASYEHVRGPLPMVGRVGDDAGAPLLGEHTRDLLVEMGYGPERIASLIQSGAVFTT